MWDKMETPPIQRFVRVDKNFLPVLVCDFGVYALMEYSRLNLSSTFSR